MNIQEPLLRHTAFKPFHIIMGSKRNVASKYFDRTCLHTYYHILHSPYILHSPSLGEGGLFFYGVNWNYLRICILLPGLVNFLLGSLCYTKLVTYCYFASGLKTIINALLHSVKQLAEVKIFLLRLYHNNQSHFLSSSSSSWLWSSSSSSALSSSSW